MNDYPTTKLRPVFAVAAIAMTALTFALAIGLPAIHVPEGVDRTALAAAKRTAPPAEPTIDRTRIEVVGVRETTLAVRPGKPRS